eukprot:CAMPEP_0174721534 /NCGR_PEP_ID=MMETSP1094-20130205/36483_1 /TAXON_ID=156173 /ORGANISM="Chrysochromulina brevifilum, Strain UTEX LB 985" /LENGTH=41 /DNA_ID= /DNA_START= /DNA_END= /DNA_ORIENTATION=
MDAKKALAAAVATATSGSAKAASNTATLPAFAVEADNVQLA